MDGVSVLFVCLGNICRSPLAEGAFSAISSSSKAFQTGSRRIRPAPAAGIPARRRTGRSIAVAAENGIDLSRLKARQINKRDFSTFDLILGMDASNVAKHPSHCAG